jgi:hypothetical protein
MSMQWNIDAQEIRRRAAKVRGAWTPSERRRRTGLPPDIPNALREYMLSPRRHAWPTGAHAPNH